MLTNNWGGFLCSTLERNFDILMLSFIATTSEARSIGFAEPRKTTSSEVYLYPGIDCENPSKMNEQHKLRASIGRLVSLHGTPLKLSLWVEEKSRDPLRITPALPDDSLSNIVRFLSSAGHPYRYAVVTVLGARTQNRTDARLAWLAVEPQQREIAGAEVDADLPITSDVTVGDMFRVLPEGASMTASLEPNGVSIFFRHEPTTQPIVDQEELKLISELTTTNAS